MDPATGQCFDPSGGCVPLDVFGEGRLSQVDVDVIDEEDAVIDETLQADKQTSYAPGQNGVTS